ncbi:MAG: ATP phosphoribosyltransferase regulatory subunit, partial [Clostridium sp.]|nr:ATP phosphoribosyltransferase regulatory subunit [Clostridium sp.]
MALKKKPVTGMKDILPAEMEIRDYVLGIIKDTYREYGYSTIETPCVEHIENLTSKQGGDNEKLIFKIMKRGDKLQSALDENKWDEIADSGLRYDLTLPLCRYYSNNAASLPQPFKALQVGSVWRADRPQKGRFRQFVQCDIDVLGDPTNQVEIESILAITKTLKRILPDNKLTVRVNDRAILKGMADYCGFPEDRTMDVFITLDKMDKIGLDGVKQELLDNGYAQDSVDKYVDLLGSIKNTPDGVRELGERIASAMNPAKAANLAEIMETAKAVTTLDFNLEFDPTLVRGMGYYTGTIFEVSMEGFGGSVSGGGRYDQL